MYNIEDYISLLREIRKITAEKGSTSKMAIDTSKRTNRILGNIPAISLIELFDYKDKTRLVFESIWEFLRSRQDIEKFCSKEIVDSIVNNTENFYEILNLFLSNNLQEISSRIIHDDKSLSFITFMLKESLQPYIRYVKEKVNENIAKWDLGICPICGSYPYMCIIQEDGSRGLYCSFCGQNWRFRRIGCPFCGNEKQESLGYLTPDKEPWLRIYFCSECKRYLKTVDGRELEREINVDEEYIRTLHLDLIANSHGLIEGNWRP